MNAKQYRIQRDNAIEKLSAAQAVINSQAIQLQRLMGIVESEDRLALVEENEELRHKLSATEEASAILMEENAAYKQRIDAATKTFTDLTAQRAQNTRPARQPMEVVKASVVETQTGHELHIEDGRIIPCAVSPNGSWVLYKATKRNALQFAEDGTTFLNKAHLEGLVKAIDLREAVEA